MRFLGCHLYNCFSYFFNRENEASLAVLPDLLMELDCMNEVCILWNSKFIYGGCSLSVSALSRLFGYDMAKFKLHP